MRISDWSSDVCSSDLLAAQGLSGLDIAHFAAAIPAKGAAGALAAKAGIAAEAVVDDLAANLGFAGCAHPLLMLAAAPERAKAGEKILVLGFGQGPDALLLEATGAPRPAAPAGGLTAALPRSRREGNYIQFQAFAGQPKL